MIEGSKGRGEPAAGRSRLFLTTNWDLRALLCFLALSALFYAPQLLGLRTFPDGDFTHHFLPFNLLQQRDLLAGRLPLWNLYTYSGHPFLADVQAAVFYPLGNLLLLLTLPLSSAAARLYLLQLEAALHVALAGWFTYLLVRDLTQRPQAALLAGVTFAFSGYLTSYPPLQLAILRSAIWLPLLLWGLRRALLAPDRWRWWIGSALVYATAFLAGHPQTFLHVSYVAAAWWSVLLVRQSKQNKVERSAALRPRTPIRHGEKDARFRYLRHVLVGTLAFALLALGLSAAQLLPSLEFTRLSVRADVSYDFVSGGFPLRDLWQLLLPAVLTQFAPLYIGLPSLMLALCAFPLTINHSPLTIDPSPLFFLALTLLALLLALGDNAFLYPLFYRFAPGWNLFRGQERAAYLVAFGLSVLTGYGAAVLPTLAWRWRHLLALALAALVSGGLVLFGLLWQLPARNAVNNARFLLIAGLTVAFALATIALIYSASDSRRWRRWLTLAVLANLFLVNFFLANLSTNVDSFGPARKMRVAPEITALEAALSEASQAGDAPTRVHNEFRLYEDYGIRHRIEDTWGSSPLRLARYAQLFDEFPLDRLWRLTGVSHVFTWRRDLFEPSDLLAEFPQPTDTTFLHRLREPNPYAWVVFNTRRVDDATALALLADHEFDLETTALLAPDAEIAEMRTEVNAPLGARRLSVQRLGPGRLRLAVESEHEGLLVVSENWMPGWRVINQPELPVLRTNLTFLGLPIPSGPSTIELAYRPRSVQLGLLLSAATLALLVVAVICRWRSRP